MADDKTRTETVTENMEAIIEQRGPEAFNWLNYQALQDINISLAMLVDSQPSS